MSLVSSVKFSALIEIEQKGTKSHCGNFTDFLVRYLELEQIIGKQPAVENPLKNVSISGKSDVEQALHLRSFWNLGTDSLYNILELLEDKGIKIIELDSKDSIDGLSSWVNGAIPVIGLNCDIGEYLDRYRFTTLHELGHLFLNIHEFSSNDQEKLCHYFAGAMLLNKKGYRS